MARAAEVLVAVRRMAARSSFGRVAEGESRGRSLSRTIGRRRGSPRLLLMKWTL